ncbi:Uncharacterised protein [Streptococcus acidominimus]|uniref:Uncharacterized protein n=1 Tax=Streptococcus acidominimus TaxID=1326 RepID=A0A380IDZ5_STRAI|nr:Uncharacterised protein [Streptococcus acidominimus]
MKPNDKRIIKQAVNVVIKEPKKSNIELVREFSCCKKTQRTTTTNVY